MTDKNGTETIERASKQPRFNDTNSPSYAVVLSDWHVV